MADAPPTSPADSPAPRNNRKRKAIGVFLFVLAAMALSGFAYWKYRQTHVSTDDAYIDGRIHLISSRVQGTVVEVRVRDNQPVGAGDPLLRIDPEPFAVRESAAVSAVSGGAADLVAARKDVEAAKAQLLQLSAGIEAARAGTALAEARRSQTSRDAARMKRLFDRQVISRESFEKSQTDAEVVKAQDDLAKEELRLAEAAIPTQEAQIAQREARVAQQQAQVRQRESALAEAKLLHRYTTVLSPADGYVTRKSVEAGQVVSPGQSLLAVAALDNVWVMANFKETDIERIRPGQEVEIRVDTFKGKIFKGTVDSIMAGTGSAFALFPPENASGNYVKVVQRVPVKIVLSRGEDPDHILRIGMSVIPTVLVH
ncbi:MAG: HlyD family secretion protein [Candidatus Deferrimicrobium sp.]